MRWAGSAASRRVRATVIFAPAGFAQSSGTESAPHSVPFSAHGRQSGARTPNAATGSPSAARAAPAPPPVITTPVSTSASPRRNRLVLTKIPCTPMIMARDHRRR